MKKLIALLLCLVMVCALAACAGGEAKKGEEAKSDFKVGFIFLHDENSTYDLNFINAANAAKAELGLTDDQVIIRKNVPEGQECYNAAAELVDEGCDIIFADSFGHEDFIAAGKFTAEEAKIGYIGAFTYAEVVSGYTSFFLGARSVCPTVTMDVTFTGSWYDETAEKEGAQALIGRDCKLISQHADSMGAPTACETAGIPNVSYNGSTEAACPNTYIVSSRIDWTPYFVFAIKAAMNGEEIPYDWCGGLKEGSVVLTDINTNVAAEGTAEKLEEVKKGLEDGTIHVYDVTTFTVDGKQLDSYLADVDTDPAYEKDTEVIHDGYFDESNYRSAPYFDLRIDGINLLDEKY